MAIEDNMYSGERIVRKFHPSPFNFIWSYLLGVVLIIPGLVTVICPIIGVVLIIYTELDRRSITYMITDKRIMKERGIFGKTNSSTIYTKITDIHSSQSAIQSMLGIGDISINTAGGEGPEINIRGIGDMPSIKKEIEQAWAGGAKP